MLSRGAKLHIIGNRGVNISNSVFQQINLQVMSIISGNVKNVVNVARQAVGRNDQSIKKLPFVALQASRKLFIDNIQVSTNNCNRSTKFVGGK